MPIYKGKLLLLEATVHEVVGEVTFQELLDAVTTYYEGSPTRHVVWDLTKGSIEKLNFEQLHELAEIIRDRSHSVCGESIAWVAPRDVDYGCCREIEAITSFLPSESKVFRTMEETWSWFSEDYYVDAS